MPRPEPPPPPPPDSLPGRVRQALYALPVHFHTRTALEGIAATDLQTLNTVLGAAIEDQVVATLNRLRPVWDPDAEYAHCFFQRQAQTFPDVLLKAEANGQDIRLGIELKGWYLLAKEGMPNFRFRVTPAACAPSDLICVVPWYLSNVLSGTPVVAKPFLVSAHYAALYRNWWWAHGRTTAADVTLQSPEGVGPYPTKPDRIVDQPTHDPGSNFGRLARTGLMGAYIQEMREMSLAGIPVRAWIEFLLRFRQ